MYREIDKMICMGFYIYVCSCGPASVRGLLFKSSCCQISWTQLGRNCSLQKELKNELQSGKHILYQHIFYALPQKTTMYFPWIFARHFNKRIYLILKNLSSPTKEFVLPFWRFCSRKNKPIYIRLKSQKHY